MQSDDGNEKGLCEIAKTEGRMNMLDTSISNLEKSCAESNCEIAALTGGVAASTVALQQLDKDGVSASHVVRDNNIYV